MNIQIVVRLTYEGVHRCPYKFEGVEFLMYPHRHLFHITAIKNVTHADRDIEFILLKREILDYLETCYHGDFGTMSCEMIALDLIKAFDLRSCEVSEDGENGALVASSEDILTLPQHSPLFLEIVVGEICSGKTTYCKQKALKEAWQHVEVSSIVAKLLQEQSLKNVDTRPNRPKKHGVSREALQSSKDLAPLLATYLVEKCKAQIAAGCSVVVDGIRQLEVVKVLLNTNFSSDRKLVVSVVHLHTSSFTQFERWYARELASLGMHNFKNVLAKGTIDILLESYNSFKEALRRDDELGLSETLLWLSHKGISQKFETF